MPLTQEKFQRLENEYIAIRAAPEANALAGGGYGLYTARTPQEMRTWMQRGPARSWCDALYNTALFMLAMPEAQTQFVLFVPSGGNPNGETYSVAHRPGARGAGTTLPKVNSVNTEAAIAATMALAGATPQAVHAWVLEQI